MSTSVDIFLSHDAELKVKDVPNVSIAGARCTWIDFDDGTALHLMGSDAERVAACNLLSAAVDEIRDAAMARIRAQELAAIDDVSPAESREVVAEWTRGQGVTA